MTLGLPGTLVAAKTRRGVSSRRLLALLAVSLAALAAAVVAVFGALGKACE